MRTTLEEKDILNHIKSSFHCWKAEKESKPSLEKMTIRIRGHAAMVFSLYLATLSIGFVIGYAKDISLMFYDQ